MANLFYTKAKEHFLSGDIDLITDTIKVALIDLADYTPDFALDEFYDDIPSGAVVALSSAMSTKSVTSGVFDADNVVLSAVTGDQAEALVIFQDTGTPSTSLLIAFFDTVTGLPVTPNTGDITITWDNSTSKIFRLL